MVDKIIETAGLRTLSIEEIEALKKKIKIKRKIIREISKGFYFGKSSRIKKI